MGSFRLQGMLEAADAGMIDYESVMYDHLVYNHYPPHSPALVPICMEAVWRVKAGDGDHAFFFETPQGTLSKTADELVEAFHLEPFLYSMPEEPEGGD